MKSLARRDHRHRLNDPSASSPAALTIRRPSTTLSLFILASLAMLALSIFGPGIANGLIAGGPQLGAARPSERASRSLVSAPPAPVCRGRARRRWRLDRREGAQGRERRRRRRLGFPRRRGNRSAAAAVSSPLRRATSGLQDSFAGGASAVTGGANPSGTSASAQAAPGPQASAPRTGRSPIISRAASVADHAIRSGDRPSGGASVDLSEGE